MAGDYQNPTCKSCGAVIKFIRLRNKEGVVKPHPVNVDPIFVILTSGEQDAEKKWIYVTKKGYQSHFATCPNAAQHRNSKGPAANEQKPSEEAVDVDSAGTDKVPF